MKQQTTDWNLLLQESIANVIGRSGSSLIDILRHAVHVLKDLRKAREALEVCYAQYTTHKTIQCLLLLNVHAWPISPLQPLLF
jgi:hypothetical protein